MMARMHKLFVVSILGIFALTEMSAAPTDLKVRLVNGTTGQSGTAELIRVILLKDAMHPIRDVSSVSGRVTLSDLELPEGIPVLLQIFYKGAHYNKMIPPVAEIRSQEQEIVVYEPTSNSSAMVPKSLIQFVRMKEFLQVYKIYILQNTSKPARAYSAPGGLDFYIPLSATNLMGTWTQEGSKMGIPIEFQKKSDTIHSIERSVLPGTTEVQISYQIPWTTDSLVVQDQILFEEKGRERPIFLRPQDMKVEFSSDGEPMQLKEGIPEGLNAYMVKYSEGSKETEIRLSGGTPIVPRFANTPRQVVNGNLIPEWDSALVALVGFIALMFSFKYTSDFWLKRRSES